MADCVAGMSVQIHIGDAAATLATMAAESVHCVVTSPPYFGLRDYGYAGQLGLEATPGAYVAALVGVFREVRRVLRDDGTLWLNLGDSYAGGGTIGRNDTTPEALARRAERYGTGTGSGSAVGAMGTRPRVAGLKQKDLIGIPWAVAFALRDDGWYLRQDIIWSKPNPMPESVTDRCTKAHEYIFMLSKSARYYFDAAAIKEAAANPGDQSGFVRGAQRRARALGRDPSGNEKPGASWIQPKTRNKRSVWTVTPMPYARAHFATFPPKLIEPCILAGCPIGGTVLDPFGGAGTTGLVAARLGRHAALIDINPDYVDMARERIANDAPKPADVVAA